MPTTFETRELTTAELITKIDEASEAFASEDAPLGKTLVHYDAELSEMYDASIYAISELDQSIGGFKIRGAFNHMRQHPGGSSHVTSSEGTHGLGVAMAARKLNQFADIFLSEKASESKVADMKLFGGSNVTVHRVAGSKTYEDAEAAAQEYAHSSGANFVHPFDDPDVIAGQGTLGNEVSPPDVLVVPVGGGGLAAGMGSALKAKNPDMQLVGVEPVGAASMTHAIEKGYVEDLSEPLHSKVPGLAVRRAGALAFKLLDSIGIDMLTVSDRDVRVATNQLWQRHMNDPSRNWKAELAGSATFAVMKKLGPMLGGKTVAYVMSGGNLTEREFEQYALPFYREGRRMLN